MTWIELLLANQSPCFRLLVLGELLSKKEDDPEVQELLQVRQSDPLALSLFELQAVDGSFQKSESLSLHLGPLRRTVQAMIRLGYLGFDASDPGLTDAADFLFQQQRADGSWPIEKSPEIQEDTEGYSMIPLQTALPLRALATCGFATDPRAERAYEWLLQQRLPDGAWPTGIASGNYGYVAGYRKLAHSRWGCRSNTTAVLCCLAAHPLRRAQSETQRALDILLGRETYEKQNLGFEVARTIGFEPSRGFMTYHAKFDVALVLDLCAKIGADRGDERVVALLDFVRQQQNKYGFWEYGPQPQASQWITFDLLRSLSVLDTNHASEWVSHEPRTPFQSYPTPKKRF